MPFDFRAEQIFAKATGRNPETSAEKAFLQSASQRKSGAALQGAVEFAQQEGKFASSNPQANVQQNQDAGSLIKSAIGDVRSKAKEVENLRTKLLMEDERKRIRQAVLADPEFQKLNDLKAQLDRGVQEQDVSFDRQEGITNPATAARLEAQTRGDLAESASRLGTNLRQRETGVRDIIDEIGTLRQEEFDSAQLSFENSRDYLQDVLSVRADERATVTSDLQAQKLRQDLTGGVISKEKLAEWSLEFGSEALSELNHVLGLPANAPFVAGANGLGYQNGDNTFYDTQHKGIDIIAPENSPIQASVPLKITNVYTDAEGGNIVEGVDAQGTTHKFMHLNQALVSVGDEINAGEVFALSGNTGTLTTDPHVHFELSDGQGNNIDPRNYALQGQSTFVSRRKLEQIKANAGAEDDMRQEYVKASGEFLDVQRSYARVLASADQPSAAGDLALIFNYMKILDPGSVVREGEFATAQNSAGIPERIRNQYNRALEGERLSDNQRDDFVDRAGKLFDSQKDIQGNLANYYKGLASQRGLNTENVVPPFESLLAGPSSAASEQDFDFITQQGF